MMWISNWIIADQIKTWEQYFSLCWSISKARRSNQHFIGHNSTSENGKHRQFLPKWTQRVRACWCRIVTKKTRHYTQNTIISFDVNIKVISTILNWAFCACVCIYCEKIQQKKNKICQPTHRINCLFFVSSSSLFSNSRWSRRLKK